MTKDNAKICLQHIEAILFEIRYDDSQSATLIRQQAQQMAVVCEMNMKERGKG